MSGKTAGRNRGNGRRSWTLLACIIAAPVLLPVVMVFASWRNVSPENWQHLQRWVLPELFVNTGWLIFGVATLTAILGTSLGWLTAICRFPGRKAFSWALLLPMAMPAYVLAFVYIGLLDFSGPLQTSWREISGSTTALPPIRSRGGVIFVLSLALYPYVYLVARHAFLSQGTRAIEVAQSLGMSRRMAFWRVSLPLSTPWIVGGLLLVLLETLADFGAVATFNYNTFTTAIYKSWFDLREPNTALQLASVLLGIALLLMLLEQLSRRRMRFSLKQSDRYSIQLRGGRSAAAFAWCLLVLFLGFILPAIQLTLWIFSHALADLDSRYWGFALRSASLAGMTALLLACIALLLLYCRRMAPGGISRMAEWFSRLGYALPGTVLAIGVAVPLARFSGYLQGHGWPVMLNAGVGALLLAYGIRFFAVALNPSEKAMLRVTPSIDDAARSLGAGFWRVLGRVHLPMVSGGLFTAMALVFVDVMKEMPITLLVRPFGWDTLAVRVFEMTAEGEWQRAALPAMAIVITGLLPVLLLVRKTEK